jgi:hypothetical protein
VFLITFSKAGQEDIVLTEDDLFDFQYEASCYSGETFELGGVNAKTLYLLIDNNTQRFSRGTFANCRVKLEIDGKFFGYYNTELPKRRNGVIELTAYDDMVKLDTEFPTDYTFPQTFWAVYAQCVFEAGLASEVSFDNVVLNGAWDNGIISADYTQYIYANSCRNLVAGMAEWNGGYAHINDDGKLQIDKFSKIVSREYRSGDLMELDYSDETVTFSKVKTSQKNKTYEMGTDDGYTLVLNNQYIGYGLDDTSFETALEQIYNYYKGFDLTPMSFTLAEPDFDLRIGDRVKVYDEEEQVAITGNVSKIAISGNCSMTVTCGGFENVSSSSGFTPTSYSQIQQSKQDAKTSSQTTGGTLNEYKYLTNTSVKFNGVTYTVEKDAETGLISKISDSAGNEFEPEISAGITDVAAHNAVFWAVAMCRGISKMAFIMDGIFGMFTPDTRDIANSRWRNSVSGYNDITLSGGSENGSALHFNPGEYGSLICDEPNTVYCVTDVEFKQVSSETWIPLITKKIAPDRPNYGYDLFSLCLADKRNLLSFSAIICDIISEADSSEIHTVCYTRDNGKAYLYIDSVLVGTQLSVYRGNYSGNMLLNYSSRGGVIPSEHELGGSNFYMCAFGSQYHDEATVRNNSAYLMKKYKIGGNT